MKDENLTFWTKAPNFFLVATYQGEIVGMIAIQKKEETGTQSGLEVFVLLITNKCLQSVF